MQRSLPMHYAHEIRSPSKTGLELMLQCLSIPRSSFIQKTNRRSTLTSNAIRVVMPPSSVRSPREALAVLEKRIFQCPTNTFDCSSIGRPNSCCAQGEVCNIIQDTGLGDVACCPANAQCSGNLLNCDLGFTKCSDNLGGGCCIPQYVCIDIGCKSFRVPRLDPVC